VLSVLVTARCFGEGGMDFGIGSLEGKACCDCLYIFCKNRKTGAKEENSPKFQRRIPRHNGKLVGSKKTSSNDRGKRRKIQWSMNMYSEKRNDAIRIFNSPAFNYIN
jgi:hypothetical protein